MGGVSHSLWSVPSKSVDISLIGVDITASRLRGRNNRVIQSLVKVNIPLEEQYDDAMFAFSQGQYETAIEKFQTILEQDPSHFDAQLSLGMACYRKGDFARAIAEGHKAEQLRPKEQLVHTNLSLFYMKAGDKKTAEHHGLQARIASWRTPTAPEPKSDPELEMAKPKPPPPALKASEMPWKKQAPAVAVEKKNE
jgi:tetratricopeptide (TPR) repeat protein